MPERELNAGMRGLLGVIGGAGVIAGIAVAVVQLRALTNGASLALTSIVAAMAVLVAGSCAYIIRGAIRGRIVVRRTGAQRASRSRT
jgi:hypothetical protein